MAKGPAPKTGVKLGHTANRVVAPGDGEPKSWELPQHPTDEWCKEAREWWRLAVESPSALLWTESDRPKLERTAWMVDRWWLLTITNPSEAMRMADNVRRAEEDLYLSPKARAAAGVSPEKRRSVDSTSGNARARLTALRGGNAVDTG